MKINAKKIGKMAAALRKKSKKGAAGKGDETPGGTVPINTKQGGKASKAYAKSGKASKGSALPKKLKAKLKRLTK